MENLDDLLNKGFETLLFAVKNNDEIYYNMSIEIFREIIDLRPDFSAAYLDMGIALNTLGEKKEAIKKDNKSLRIKDEKSDEFRSLILMSRGVSNYELGNKKLARRDYQKSIEINKTNYRAYHRL